jgi:hypothetical protein
MNRSRMFFHSGIIHHQKISTSPDQISPFQLTRKSIQDGFAFALSIVAGSSDILCEKLRMDK